MNKPLADLSQRLLGKSAHTLDEEERRVLLGIEAGTVGARDAEPDSISRT